MNTQINIWIILGIIIIHWFSDFIMQDEKWATGKSKSLDLLTMHTITYSGIWFIISYILILLHYLPVTFLLFAPITFVCHTVTDYYTSKWVAKDFAKNKLGGPIPNWGAFSKIGFDQVLHYVQLLLTFLLLNK